MEALTLERRVLVPRAIGGVPLRPAFVDAPVQQVAGLTMGTTWSLRCLAEARAVDGHRDAIEQLLATLVADLSNWDVDSALSRFNRSTLDRWHELPLSLVEVLDAAGQVFVVSGGVFDPGVGAAVSRWGFGPTRDAALDHGGSSLSRIELDIANRRARRHGPVCVDLCGIAKGYAVDRVSRLLNWRGAPHHLVEIGGELRGNGVKADATPWWVALEQPPRAGAGMPETLVALHGLSIATSGDYRKRGRRDGVAVSHTIDPRTRAPVANDLCSVTVIHADCVFADAHATAMMVMGAEAGLAYAGDQRLAALVHARHGRGGLVSRASPEFDALLA